MTRICTMHFGVQRPVFRTVAADFKAQIVYYFSGCIWRNTVPPHTIYDGNK